MILAPLDFEQWFSALPVLLIAATFTWLLSLPLHNVSIVDPLKSLMLFAAGVLYGLAADPRAPRLAFVLWLMALWAGRQSIFLIARSAGKGEDPRYQALRTRHGSHFRWKSLYCIFWLQAVAAWIVSLPLLGAFASNAPLGLLDYLGVLLWLTGFVLEAGSDWQLSRFRRNPANAGAVPDRGFWRYLRHPNYLGTLCVWWGFWCMATSAGAWWSVVGPVLLTLTDNARLRRWANR
jgi:steroid 5-alpha reductase family enzyme